LTRWLPGSKVIFGGRCTVDGGAQCILYAPLPRRHTGSISRGSGGQELLLQHHRNDGGLSLIPKNPAEDGTVPSAESLAEFEVCAVREVAEC